MCTTTNLAVGSSYLLRHHLLAVEIMATDINKEDNKHLARPCSLDVCGRQEQSLSGEAHNLHAQGYSVSEWSRRCHRY